MKITNKMIHEARGLCWHEFQSRSSHCICIKCELKIPYHTVIPPKPDYITCLADAWELIEEVRRFKFNFDLLGSFLMSDIGNYCCVFHLNEMRFNGIGKTPMKAIALAYYRWKKQ